MKKILFAIFAHPDDEAFGPSGTLLLESRAGTDLHLITLTAGENGMNPDNHDDLKSVRLDEWRAAGALLGATDMHYLGYVDGQLSNEDFLNIANDTEEVITSVVSRYDQPVVIELITNDLNGITGHIDHIVAARVACYVFYKLQRDGLPVQRIRLTCIPHSHMPEANIDFVYMEPGRTKDEIDEIIDARSVLDDVYAIMRCHNTQRADGEAHIKRRGENVAINHFIVQQ
jgi:LmbE family N-acetylglucosaminyl deacetylase